MSKGRKRKACSGDKNEELMAEFHRLRDETQPIHNSLMALTPLPLINPSDGQLLRELQLMRSEMKQIQKDINENFEQIREEVAEVKNNQQSLSAKVELSKVSHETNHLNMNKRLDELKKNQKDLKKKMEVAEMKNNQEVLKNNQEELKNALTANASNLDILKRKIEFGCSQIGVIKEKVSKLKCRPTIRDAIPGKWKNNNGRGQVISIEIHNNEFIIEYNSNEKDVHTFGIVDSKGYTLKIEGEKIVRFATNWKREFYLEDGMLVILDKIPGREDVKSILTRIGDNDPK